MAHKPAHRVKGNQKHGAAADLMRKLEYDLEYDPLVELVSLIRDNANTMELKELIKINEILMQYRYPKLQAIKVEQEQQNTVTINLDLSGAKDQDSDKNLPNIPGANVGNLNMKAEVDARRNKRMQDAEEEAAQTGAFQFVLEDNEI